MIENFNSLFQYLDSEKILIDKKEFLFQIQAHPEFPSLLSISDTLIFFNIDNSAFSVSFSDIEFLPTNFITMLYSNNRNTELFFVKKKEENYFIIEGKKNTEISLADLQSRWKGIVFIVEKPEFEMIIASKNKFRCFLPILCLLLFITVIYQSQIDIYYKIFLVFPFLGFLLSIIALKDLFGTKSEFFAKLCNITSSSNCETVVGSTKWKFFEFINFSDLAITFFSFQIIGWLFFMFLGQIITFLSLIQIVLFCSLSIISLSFYFQKFVEKKWCPVCLMIISLVLIELMYLYAFTNLSIIFSLQNIILFSFVFLFIIIAWQAVKKILIDNKKLKESQFKSNRFIRNYQIFKNSLLSNKKIEIFKSSIILGNPKSGTIISIITNPFCEYCKDAHLVIDKILEKFNDSIQVQIIFNVDIEKEVGSSKHFFDSLLNIYFTNGETNFKKAILDWFKTKNVDKWLTLYKTESNYEKTNHTYKTQNNWCLLNRMNFTPVIFINGYQYPDAFDKENLEYYILELIEDTTL